MGSQEAHFWRQRMIVAMKSRLERCSEGEELGFQVYSVHDSSGGSKPLAMAMVSTRSFSLEPLVALHLDHIVGSPSQHARGRLDIERSTRR